MFISIEYNDQDDNRNKNQENQNQTNQTQDKEDDEEIDPLDAFMNGIDEEVRKEETNKVIYLTLLFIVEWKTC